MPRSILLTFHKLCIASPQAVSRVSARLNSATTRMRRRRFFPALVPVRPLSFSASFGSMREAFHAGAQPNKIPASVVTANVKSKTGMLSRMSASDGRSKGMLAMKALIITTAKPMPSVPPVTAKIKLSVRN